MALWDKSNYRMECSILRGTLSSRSIHVIPLPKNDNLVDVIRWVLCQQAESGSLS